jgi:hypothetical protein
MSAPLRLIVKVKGADVSADGDVCCHDEGTTAGATRWADEGESRRAGVEGAAMAPLTLSASRTLERRVLENILQVLVRGEENDLRVAM